MEYKILEKAGRCSSGYNNDHGKIAHAVIKGEAICGTKTPRSWSAWESVEITCEKCLKKLNNLQEKLY